MAAKGSSFLYPFLQDIPIFSGLRPEAAARIFRSGKTQIVRDGRTIVTEGKGGGDLHLIVSGQVEVWKKGPVGKPKKLAVLGCGDLFGEMSTFDGSTYSATIKASGDCAVHVIRGQVFRDYLAKNPKDAYQVLTALVRILSSRLRSMNVVVSKKG